MNSTMYSFTLPVHVEPRLGLLSTFLSRISHSVASWTMRPNHHSPACYLDANGKVELQVRGRPREDPVSSTLEIGCWRQILKEMESIVLTVPLDLNLVPPMNYHFHYVQDLEVLHDEKYVHITTSSSRKSLIVVTVGGRFLVCLIVISSIPSWLTPSERGWPRLGFCCEKRHLRFHSVGRQRCPWNNVLLSCWDPIRHLFEQGL